MSYSERRIIPFPEQDIRIHEAADKIFERGYVALHAGRKGLSGLRREYGFVIDGLKVIQISGEKDKDKENNRFLFYQKEHFKTMRRCNYDRKESKGKCSSSEITYFGFIATTRRSGKICSKPTETTLVSKRHKRTRLTNIFTRSTSAS